MSGRYAEVHVRGLVHDSEEAQEWITSVMAALHDSGVVVADQWEIDPYKEDDWGEGW